MAKAQGTMVSAVMLGIIAASGLFPMAREHYEATIGTGGSSAASLRGFAAAFERVRNAKAVQAMLADENTVQSAPLTHETALDVFPAPVRELAALGFARLCDYQHRHYAMQYVQRLLLVWEAEKAMDPTHDKGHAATCEAARWLALWMAFDDIVRVADLKSRGSRRQRVAMEVKQQDGELLRVFEHFKPGVPEFAALLPAWLDHRLPIERKAEA